MKQYRITTADFVQPSSDDCYLSPEDPIHNLMASSMLGGLGSQEALARYNQSQLPEVQGTDKGKIAREQNIKPGTQEWFMHWFSKPNLTGKPQ
jgi:hypothetical protein